MTTVALLLGCTAVLRVAADLSCRNGHCVPSDKYAELCATLRQERRQRTHVDVVYWTPVMLDVFHRGIKQCTSESNPTCDTDDDFSATFRRHCKDGGVPCVPDDVPRAQRDGAQYQSSLYARSCRQWGLSYDCVVRETRADILDAESLLAADVVLFDGTNNRVWNHGVYPPYKCADQLWTMFEFRPASVYPFLFDRAYTGMFDVTAGYSRNWTIWTPDYVAPPDFFTKLVPADQVRAANPVMVMISQCNTPNRRMDYVEAMAKLIGVDSYGACMRTVEWPAELLQQRNKYAQKAVVMRQYWFYLAFENSNEPDYVSEKIYNALSEGVVPVYMGAPNVALYVPSNSYINVADYDTPEALVAYLRHLLATPAEYNAYLAWKTKPAEAHMVELKRSSKANYMCRICQHAKQERSTRAAQLKSEL
jgi:hypothetical protein